MRKLLVAALILLAGCSSAPTAEEVESVKHLRAAADQLLKDQDDLEDALEKSAAHLAVLEHAQLVAYSEKSDANALDRLALVLRVKQSSDDCRSAARSVRHAAARISAAADALEDPNADESERERIVRELGAIEVDLKAAVREQKVATDRLAKARALAAPLLKPGVPPK